MNWWKQTKDDLGTLMPVGVSFVILAFCAALFWALEWSLPDARSLETGLLLGAIVGPVVGPMVGRWEPLGKKPVERQDQALYLIALSRLCWRSRAVGDREMPTMNYDNNMKGWGPELVKRRPDITMETVDKFLTKMYRTNADFVFTVTRDFVRNCRTPVLILPDDVPAHPYAVAMEAAMLAPKAEVSMFPWKEPKERIPLAVRQIRSFLRAHRSGFCLDGNDKSLLLRL